MQIYCTGCGRKQKADEKKCEKCGASFGGDLNTLLMGGGLLLGLPLMVLLASPQDFYSMISNKTVQIAYFLPVLCGTAILYDNNSKRRTLYFYGLPIIVGLWLLGLL